MTLKNLLSQQGQTIWNSLFLLCLKSSVTEKLSSFFVIVDESFIHCGDNAENAFKVLFSSFFVLKFIGHLIYQFFLQVFWRIDILRQIYHYPYNWYHDVKVKSYWMLDEYPVGCNFGVKLPEIRYKVLNSTCCINPWVN